MLRSCSTLSSRPTPSRLTFQMPSRLIRFLPSVILREDGNPDRPHQIFDSLSYSKAGSVLRMLANYVGEDIFLKGVSIYLKKHLYGNSVTNDLWSGIAEASGIDVPKMMNNWVMKVCTSLHAGERRV